MGQQSAGADRKDLDEAGEDMCLRQEQQGAHASGEDLGDLLLSSLHRLHEVPVCEDAALGLAGGAGGVDEGGDRFAGDL